MKPVRPLTDRAPAKAAETRAARPKPLRRRGAARSIPEHAPDSEFDPALVERPDGWYWVAPDGRQQFGPFETLGLARADRDRVTEESVNEAEAEREAEQELGVEDAIREEAEPPLDSDDAAGGDERRVP